MLRYLKISNLAIIDKVEVEFGEGFNVLTGETGAGKSILIGALNLLLGSRATADIIRTGEEEAQVEGLFEVPESVALPADLEEYSDSGEIVLSRKISRSGRSRCIINGSMASLNMLQTVGPALVSIFGQHEHRVLLDPDEHIEILDRFGELEHTENLVADAFAAWKKAERELSGALKRVEDLERQSRENADIVKELTKAALKEGEEDELVQEREASKKAVQIRERAFEAYQTLYARSGSVISSLSDVRKAVDFLASVHPKLSGLKESLEEAVYRIEDVSLELRDVAQTFHCDPARLEQIEERLALIRRLKRKYGKDITGLIELLESLSQEAGNLLDAEGSLNKLRNAAGRSRDAYFETSKDLSKARRRAAGKLEAAMKLELKELAMPDAVFSVNFEELEAEKASAKGLERVEFFLASNPGEAARPLARIASGGELSRIMLALKALQTDSRGASTVIFDEVDTGIGGNTAFAVASRLSRVSRRQQLLCVTHLHQIAALADYHFSVKKFVTGGRTQIQVLPLNSEDKVAELTRMMGAGHDPESVKEHVKRLMDRRTLEGNS
jgi:DNA repair protein RecN (Recombination protein N)